MSKFVDFRKALVVAGFCVLGITMPAQVLAEGTTSSVTVIGTSNYLFRGATQSLHEPSIQASFDVASGPF
jgi:hypothetical protein